MLITLPLFVLLGIAAFAFVRTQRLRESLVISAVVCAVLVWASTEFLSVFTALTATNIKLFWAIALVVVASLLYVRRERLSLPRIELTVAERLLLAASALFWSAILVNALVSPPNTWDVMDYHLVRAAEWISNASVRPYPTHDFAQLVLSPFAEYCSMQSLLLTGTDRFVNLIEAVSLVFCGILASLIAQSLRAGRAIQFAAALAVITIPGAVLEASGAMTTLVVSIWVMAAVYFFLRFNETGHAPYLFTAGVACGIAVFTKGTAYVVLPGLLLACFLLTPRALKLRAFVYAPLCVLLIVSISAPQYLRNRSVTGTLFGVGPAHGSTRLDLTAHPVSLRGTFSSATRNVALHFATPSDRANAMVVSAGTKLMRLVGADPQDPAYTFRSLPFALRATEFIETDTGDLLHVLLFALAIGLALICRLRDELILFGGVLLSFLMTCALLKWQPWAGRYHLPIVAIGAAIAIVVLARKSPKWAYGAVVGLVIGALPFLLLNRLRPLVSWHGQPSIFSASRTDLYFADRHQDVKDEFVSASRFIDSIGCERVKLDAVFDHYEYPAIALIESSSGWKAHVELAGVMNDTARFTTRHVGHSACAVMCIACTGNAGKAAEYASVAGSIANFGQTAVFYGPPRSGADDPVAADSAEQLLVNIDNAYQSVTSVRIGEADTRLQCVIRKLGRNAQQPQYLVNRLRRRTVRALNVMEFSAPLRERARTGPITQQDLVQLRSVLDGLKLMRLRLDEDLSTANELAASTGCSR